MQTNQTHNATIAYQAPRRFDIGDVFYRIERAGEKMQLPRAVQGVRRRRATHSQRGYV